MTKLLERAIAEIRKLPTERQDDAAGMILQMVEQEKAQYRLTSEQRADVERSIREADAGKFLDEEEIERLYKKYGA